MKTLSIFLFSLFVCSKSFCQVQPKLYLSAGDHLQKGGRQIKTGLIVSAIGSGIGFMAISASDDTASRTAGALIIVISNLVGLICEISGASHLIKAGNILNDQKIGVAINENGIGLRLKL
jgi:hypothetical protein